VPRAIAFTLVMLLASCASSGRETYTSNKLDSLTGVTITYSKTPMVFYRDESGKAAHARSFVDMAPLEINRMGQFRYFLWLGIWNTLQQADPGEARDGFESIVIFADGEPLSLELAGWSADVIGASEPVYLKSVSSAADAYYEITIDHLRVIAAASDVRIVTAGPRPKSFELWNQQRAARVSLNEFLNLSVY
jgi:hypothetical protein